MGSAYEQFSREELLAILESEALVVGSEVQLHQVIMNLCVNAARAMDNAGPLALKLQSVLATPELCKHDGAITVTSAPGEGTTFEVYFPTAE